MRNIRLINPESVRFGPCSFATEFTWHILYVYSHTTVRLPRSVVGELYTKVFKIEIKKYYSRVSGLKCASQSNFLIQTIQIMYRRMEFKIFKTIETHRKRNRVENDSLTMPVIAFVKPRSYRTSVSNNKWHVNLREVKELAFLRAGFVKKGLGHVLPSS